MLRSGDRETRRSGLGASGADAAADTRPAASGGEHFAFILVEGFSALCLMAALEGLRAANYILGHPFYRWSLVSHDGAPVLASNAIAFPVAARLDGELRPDYAFVVSSFDNDPPYRARLHSALRQLDRAGVALGALSSGTFILARAGLLLDARCTVHWEYQPAFREAFPEIALVPDLFVIDRGRHTSSGGISGLDLVLQLVRSRHGPEIAQKVANNFQLERIRRPGVPQRAGGVTSLDTLPPAVQDAIRLMLNHLETPLSNRDLAAALGASVRNLERMFRRNLGASPARYYLSLRLEEARELLMHTNRPTLDIALQCGFSSSSYFARCFQREFGRRPSDMRREERAAGRR